MEASLDFNIMRNVQCQSPKYKHDADVIVLQDASIAFLAACVVYAMNFHVVLRFSKVGLQP